LHQQLRQCLAFALLDKPIAIHKPQPGAPGYMPPKRGLTTGGHTNKTKGIDH
jgi:hypothetical protein